MTKPHIRRVRGIWSCLSLPEGTIGFGSTPQRAYEQWVAMYWVNVGFGGSLKIQLFRAAPLFDSGMSGYPNDYARTHNAHAEWPTVTVPLRRRGS